MLLDQISVVPLFLIVLALFVVGSYGGIMAAFFTLRWLDGEPKAKAEPEKKRRKRKARAVNAGEAHGQGAQQASLSGPTAFRGQRSPRTTFPDPGPARQHREPPPEPERDPSTRPVG